MARVLIAGGTGLIGRQLSRKLQEHGYEVALLSRSRRVTANVPSYFWDPGQDILPKEVLNSCEFIINLAGANIGAKRWSTKRKRLILESRIIPAKLIFNNLEENSKLVAYITASAIGYYGAITSHTIFRETDSAGVDFLGQTCKAWEEAADQFARKGIRTVKIRTGIVLAKKGGALKKLSLPIRWGFGSSLGSGKQYMPWIHLDDLCDIYLQAIRDKEMTGPYNAVAPEHATNTEFTRQAAQALHRPFWFPNLPAKAMRLFFGEMSVILLSGSRISSEKIESTGFSHSFPTLDSAFKELYSK